MKETPIAHTQQFLLLPLKRLISLFTHHADRVTPLRQTQIRVIL